jgi:hypothetical protein
MVTAEEIQLVADVQRLVFSSMLAGFLLGLFFNPFGLFEGMWAFYVRIRRLIGKRVKEKGAL